MFAEVLKERQRNLNQFFESDVLTHPHRARQVVPVLTFDWEPYGAILLAPPVDSVSKEIKYHSGVTGDVAGLDGDKEGFDATSGQNHSPLREVEDFVAQGRYIGGGVGQVATASNTTDLVLSLMWSASIGSFCRDCGLMSMWKSRLRLDTSTRTSSSVALKQSPCRGVELQPFDWKVWAMWWQPLASEDGSMMV
jgi:hypothetical protein